MLVSLYYLESTHFPSEIESGNISLPLFQSWVVVKNPQNVDHSNIYYLIWQCIKQQCSALLWLFGSFLLCTNISYLIHNLYKLKRVTVCDCDTSGALKNEMRSLRVCVEKNRCFSKLSWCCTGMTTILQAPRVLSKRLRNQSFARVRWMTCKESLFNLTLVGVSTSTLHNYTT